MTDAVSQLHAKRLTGRVAGAALCPTMDLAAFTMQDASLVLFVRTTRL